MYFIVYADLVAIQTHALVQFKVDACTAVVPYKKIVDFGTLKEGEDCRVLWGKKETYVATVIALGN